MRFARMVAMTAREEKQEERRMPVNLSQKIELRGLARVVGLFTLQPPNVAAFNMGFRDGPR